MKKNLMCYMLVYRHPEFISGSKKIRPQVQYDTPHSFPLWTEGAGGVDFTGQSINSPHPSLSREGDSSTGHPESQMLKRVQHDERGCHPEFISGSSVFRHSEFISESRIQPPVQHDTSFTRHPEFISGSSVFRHSEFISESQIRPQVQYDNLFSIHAKLWVRKIFAHSRPQLKKQFALGRSMIEMLGVLAIIGVLSIGGLTVYRQAMNRYYTNQIYDFISKTNFIYAENCTYADTCLFGDTTSYAENAQKLCERLGSEYCIPNGSSYTRFSFLKSAEWALGKYDKDYFGLLFVQLPAPVCAEIVQKKFSNLYYMGFNVNGGETNLFTTDGALSDTQKARLTEFCYSDEYSWANVKRIRLAFKIK